MPAILEFEKPIQELETKVSELRQFSREKGIDLTNEVAILESSNERCFPLLILPWTEFLPGLLFVSLYLLSPVTIDLVAGAGFEPATFRL